MDPVQRSATYDDVLAAPEHLVAEIVGGTLYTNPRPASRHAHAASTLGMDLGPPFHRGRGGPGGWWILDEPELHLGDDVLVPDLAGWRRERMPAVPDTAWFELAPDWICEVVSAPESDFLCKQFHDALQARPFTPQSVATLDHRSLPG